MLTIQDITLSYPVTKQQCEKIIKYCEKAPFGRKEETIIDEKVRKGWQILAKDLEISNFLGETSKKSKILEEIRLSLIPNANFIIAELDKFLIYGETDHFKSHKDTQRGKNHFGTLIVFLPSEYKGGDFVLSQGDEKKLFNFSISDFDSLTCQYLAFYTDSEHEIKEITKGNRITLTYNLYFDKMDIEKTFRYVDFDFNIYLQNIHGKLEELKYDSFENPSSSICFLTNHYYTPSTLKPMYLKGKDLRLYQMIKEYGYFDIELFPITIDGSEDYSVFNFYIKFPNQKSINPVSYNWKKNGEINVLDTKCLFLDYLVKLGDNNKLIDGDLQSDDRGNGGVKIDFQYTACCFFQRKYKFRK